MAEPRLSFTQQLPNRRWSCLTYVRGFFYAQAVSLGEQRIFLTEECLSRGLSDRILRAGDLECRHDGLERVSI